MPRRSWIRHLNALPGNVRGAAWLFASTLGFAAMNGLSKSLGAELHSHEISFFRCLFGFLVMVPFVFRGGVSGLRTGRPWLLVLRSVIGIGAMLATFHALTHLPLAVSITLFFTKPLWMIVLAVLFLGERVHWQRWAATLAGFGGVLVMLRPGLGGFPLDAAVLSAIGAAFGMSVVLVIIKTLTLSEKPAAMVFWFSLAAAIGTALPAWWVWKTPSPEQFALLALNGALGSLAQYCVTRAYRAAKEATAITPVDYFQLLFSGLVGAIWFGEVPEGWTLAGAGIVVLSTLYVVRYEARGRKSGDRSGRVAVCRLKR
ncbi:MAG: DMT family transporter [Rhodospirillales bacterium]|nr:DMT family transporter [Rhodospirillales bacterium]